ncbi:class I SAM-dependent methyltransferase [Elioraea rosea]|uniref:class I SAM-dependent methyltransferase n=1 Tax=Elioraea rosea TaxID=2492390 RepID=UPI0011847DD9|nr:methyltransferase domain-containing protein [Elioraea rosea]
MSATIRQGETRGAGAPARPLDAQDVRDAYRRWAGVYDSVFGFVSRPGRMRAVAALNALPAERLLEVGVGTGLALPHYVAGKRVTGIDLSPEMLAVAERRVREGVAATVEGLHEMDAEAMAFPDASFDAAVAMFVASVVPNPRRMMAEMRRVVRPGGTILLVNHFLAPHMGLRRGVERAVAPFSRALGWHPDFAMETVLSPGQLTAATLQPCPPLGIFTLVTLPRDAV